jgi:hypothetical protein
VPEIARFLGIVITMYHNDHGVPHFHARYGEFKIVVEIDAGMVRGVFPRRKQEQVLAWLRLHRQELLNNVARIRNGTAPRRIAPLE